MTITRKAGFLCGESAARPGFRAEWVTRIHAGWDAACRTRDGGLSLVPRGARSEDEQRRQLAAAAIVADPVSISRARLGRECADRRAGAVCAQAC